MAEMRPFPAIRANEKFADRIAALPYDVYNRQEAKHEIEREPLSFLRVDRAETFFTDSVSTYDACVYQKAHDVLRHMIEMGEFIRDEEPCYYIYELTMNGRSQTGIVACAGVDDYLNGIVMKHENTREDKEIDRIHHIQACNAQTGPIFLAYQSDRIINEIVDKVRSTTKPIYDFTAKDGISHRAWIVMDAIDIETIFRAFQEMEHIYIADGHHRCASAVKVALSRRSENPEYTGAEPYNYVMSVLFPHDQLMIMDYNRVIKDLGAYTPDSLLQKLESVFTIEKIGNKQYRPNRKGSFGMFLEDCWYHLQIRDAYCTGDAVKGLDVSILQDHVLNPLFHIEDPKTDQRIDFVGGIRGLEELERRVHTDCKVAFALYPTSIEELFAVADEHQLMPPKSTWFEPKLRSGLFIHDLEC
ncbi:MAG: DUF1015 family protein [Lachnospiraceae bacterium]|nr:DUF1015 family protein [Lachnospiraceae bacterium]